MILLPEHVVHILQIFVVKEPHISVFVILVERNSETIRDVEDSLAGPGPEEEPHNPLLVTDLLHPIEMVHDREKHQRVDNNLFQIHLRQNHICSM